jgi:hypothetical protein
MRKVIFAALAVLGMSLAVSALAPAVDAYTYLSPPHHGDGGNN